MALIDDSTVDDVRISAQFSLSDKSRVELGQYFTPIAAAKIMAGFIATPSRETLRILDPGAGSGILSFVLAKRLLEENQLLKIEVRAIERDTSLHKYILDSFSKLLKIYKSRVRIKITGEDFLSYALSTSDQFDIVIQNPPYKKIPAESETALALRSFGYQSPNLYSAFLELGIKLLETNGQMVSITPRSFMNGTYFKNVRARLISKAPIHGLHLFHSRSEVFKDTGVLQEAIIVYWKKTAKPPSRVEVRSSVSHTSDIQVFHAPYNQVISKGLIFAPSNKKELELLKVLQKSTCTVKELGFSVSTGKVVDFRLKDRLENSHTPGALRFIRASNFFESEIIHPLGAKPQWFKPKFERDLELLVVPGIYVLVKRFSTKEEKRRLVAAVLETESPAALDNKVNYIHIGGQGLKRDQAEILCRWLNSQDIDEYFRIFSGHTQVNAEDLRNLPIHQIFHLERELKGL